MKLLCIKRIEPYWGISFEEGKFYTPLDTVFYKTLLIIDEENYWKYTKLVIESRHYPEFSQDEMHKVIPGYLTNAQIKQKYCVEFNAEFFNIKGDDGISTSFCISTKKELLEEFNSIKFVLSIKLLEDYFVSLCDFREQRINEIFE